MFLIVEYIIGEDETEVEVVPSSWYSSGRCWWPPGVFARSTLGKKVSKSEDCDKTTWDCYDGRLIASFSTFIIYYYTEIDFLNHFDFSLQRRILKQRLSCLLLLQENWLLQAQLILMDVKREKENEQNREQEGI